MKMQSGYYWVLLLGSGMWQIARYYDDGTFQLTGDPKSYHWENMGQIGEHIPGNYELYERNKTILSNP